MIILIGLVYKIQKSCIFFHFVYLLLQGAFIVRMQFFFLPTTLVIAQIMESLPELISWQMFSSYPNLQVKCDSRSLHGHILLHSVLSQFIWI